MLSIVNKNLNKKLLIIVFIIVPIMFMLMVFFVPLVMAVDRIWGIHLGNFPFPCNGGFCFSDGNFLLARRGWSG